MTRSMYDAIHDLVPNIPLNAQLVAGYVSPSTFAWTPADFARFPNSVIVRITPQVTHTGIGIHVLDVETGDASPGQAPGWARAQRALGQIPTIYCNLSTWPLVQNAFNAAGEHQPLYWIAHPTNDLTFPTLNGITAIALQWNFAGSYDQSIVADVWPGVDVKGIVMEQTDAALGYNGQPAKDAQGNGFTVASELYGTNVASWDTNARVKDLQAQVTSLTTAVNALTGAIGKLGGNVSLAVSGTLTATPGA